MWHAEVFCRLIEDVIINRELLMHMRKLCEQLSHVQEGVANVELTHTDGIMWTDDDLKWIVPFLEICNKRRDPLTILGEIAALTDGIEKLEFLLTHAEITITMWDDELQKVLVEHLIDKDGKFDYNNIRPKGQPLTNEVSQCLTLKEEPLDPKTNPSDSG